MRLALLESARWRGLVDDLDQRCGVVGLLVRLGQDDRDRLAIPVDAVVCMTGRSLPPAASGSVRNNGGGCIRGALRWVMTSTPPAVASAAPVSSAVMRPRAIVL
jgi:hypothetical protein